MAILEFKPMEKEPKKPEKMSIIELLDQMAEQMLDFVAHYYDDFLTDGIYQAIWSKQECKVMDDLVKRCSSDAQILISVNHELKKMQEYQGQVIATYGAVKAFQMANETVEKLNLMSEEANGRIEIGEFDVGKVEIIRKILPKFEGQYDRVDYDSLDEVSKGFYPFILVDIYYNYDDDEDQLYMIGFKNKADAYKYALSEGIKKENLINMWG